MEALTATNKTLRNEYMNSFSWEINKIYLKLKKKNFTELLENKNIAKFVSEIQKNEFSDAQLYVLAKLLCYLINKKKIDKTLFIYPIGERFNTIKMEEYWENLYYHNRLNTRNLNARIQRIVSDIKNNKNIDKEIRIDIILRFIDEFIEVSKENSEYSKKLHDELKKLEPETRSTNNLYKPIPSRTLSKPISSSNNSRNFVVESIRSLLQSLNKDNIDDIIKLLINTLSSKVNKDILSKFPDLLNFQLIVFLSKLFNFSIEYISDKFIQNFLTYIIYYFVNPEMKLPDSLIFSNETGLQFTNNKNLIEKINIKQLILLDFLKDIFGEFKIPSIFINLFRNLSTHIYLLEKASK
jgi:hypothetical protein